MSNPSVRIQNGSFYLDADVYDTYFRGHDCLGVLLREGQVALVALRPGGVGGSLVKVLNARGDRVIHARELMSGLDIDESKSIELQAEWDSELAALTMRRPEWGRAEWGRAESGRAEHG